MAPTTIKLIEGSRDFDELYIRTDPILSPNIERKWKDFIIVFQLICLKY
jgi:hypothetical protein